MAAKKARRLSGTGPVKTHQLRVELHGTEPAVWRRLLVREDMNLGLLHAVLQVAMGWTNSHLHHFIVGDQRYCEPRISDDMGFDDVPDLDEEETSLMDVAPRAKARFLYEYDFGDSWQHLITVEKIHKPDPSREWFAACLDGDRACPPDDCGGIGGYAELLEIIKDPRHDEYESMMEWLGGSFDPDAFDLEKVNKYLRKLKWPRVTESQLGKVLMQRDGYRA